MRRAIPLTFPNGRGETLAGLIDMPEKAPRFYGVFGPCFTCTKESHAAARICRALAERGGAMLRFDTTGVGSSTGDISATDFTARVKDLIAACGAMAVHHHAPQLIVGHSLSGPAAIVAARQLPSLKAVATICSPSDPRRVVEKFRKNGIMKEEGGTIEVNVLGTPYTFSSSFADDMLAHDVAKDTAELEQKLFVIHAPNDAIVSYENAGILMKRAGKNAELVTLDDKATHLFNNREEDAVQVAEVLAGFFKG